MIMTWRTRTSMPVIRLMTMATLCCYKDYYDNELQDFYYAYYYDYFYGTATTEISLFR